MYFKREIFRASKGIHLEERTWLFHTSGFQGIDSRKAPAAKHTHSSALGNFDSIA